MRLVFCNVQKLGLLAFKGQAILPVLPPKFNTDTPLGGVVPVEEQS
jgi:hypothetical protein